MRIDVRSRVVQALCLLATPVVLAGQAIAAQVSLNSPTATFCQDGFPITEAIDGSLNASDGWAIDPNEGSNFVAVFKAGNSVGEAPETALRFRLHMYWGDSHTLGKFRLSATTSAQGTYGQGATCGDANPAGSATWTVLFPEAVASQQGQTLTVQPDGSVLASGDNPSTDVVTFFLTTPLQGITGFRLEALADSSLGNNLGPGRASNGNFVLTELVVEAQSIFGVPTLGAWAMALLALLLAGAGVVRLRRTQVASK